MNASPLKTLRLPAALAACLFFAAAVPEPARAAMDDPAQIQTEAFIQLLQADQALDAGRMEEALALYTAARDLYQRVSADFPEYDPRVVQYRRDYCEGQMDEVMASLGMAPRDPGPEPEVPAGEETVAAAPGIPDIPESGPAAVSGPDTDTLRAELAAALAERDSLKDAMSAQTAARKAEVESLRARVAELEEAVAAAEAAIPLGERIAELQRTLENRDADFAALQADRDALSVRVAELEAAAVSSGSGLSPVPIPPATDSDSARADLAAAREQLAAKDVALADAAEAARKLARNAEKTSKDLEQARADRADLKKQLKAAEKAAAEATRPLEERIGELQEALDGKTAELAAVQADRDALAEHAAVLEATAAGAGSMVPVAEVEALRAELAARDAALAEAAEAAEKAAAEATRPLEERIGELQEALDGKTAELAAMQVDRDTLDGNGDAPEATAAVAGTMVPVAEVETLRAELAARDAALAEAAEAARKLAGDAEKTSKNLEQALVDKADLKKQLKAAEMAAAEARAAAAEATRPLEERIDELQGALDGKTAELAAVQADRDALAEHAAALEATVSVAGTMVPATEVETLRAELATRDTALAEAAETARKLAGDAEKASKDLAQAREENAALQNRLEDAGGASAEATRSLEARIGSLQAELDGKTAELADVQADRDASSARIAELEAAATAATADLESARTELAMRDTALADASESARKLAQDAEKASKDLEQARTDKADLKKQLKEAKKAASEANAATAVATRPLEERIDELQYALDAKEAELAARTEAAAAAEARIAELDAQAAAAIARQEELDGLLQALTADSAARQETDAASLRDLAEANAALEARAADLQTRLDDTSAQLAEASATDAAREIEGLRARLAETELALAAERTAHESLDAQLADAATRADDLENRMRTLIAENLSQLETLSQTSGELAARQADLAAKTDEAARLREQLDRRDADLAEYQPLLEQRSELVARQSDLLREKRALERERDSLSAQLVEAQVRASQAEAGLRDLIGRENQAAATPPPAPAPASVPESADAPSSASEARPAPVAVLPSPSSVSPDVQPSSPDENPADTLVRARTLLLAGEAGDALAAVRGLPLPDRESLPALLLQGTALIRLQRYSEAIEMLAPAVQANPRNAELQASYGAALMGDRRTGEARSALARAVSLDRHASPETYANLAMLCAFTDPVDLKLARRYYALAREAGLPAAPQLEKILFRAD